MEKSAYDPDHLIAPRVIVPTPTTMISHPSRTNHDDESLLRNPQESDVKKKTILNDSEFTTEKELRRV